MVGHRVVSPMLYGIKDSTGLGNNAEELKTASILMQNLVIAPFQHLLIDAFDTILAYNQISLKLYFKTLQPLQFIDLENVEDEETKEEETGVKLSEQLPDEVGTAIADALIDLGEDESELLSDFDVIDEREVNYEEEVGLDEVISDLNKPQEKSTLAKVWEFVSTGKATPYRKSEQDGTSKQTDEKGNEFLVRYKYSPERTKSTSRQFCSKMVGAKKVYRKEDIEAMEEIAVNAGFGKGGSSTYSIWLYKGGARCSHKWLRKTYVRKDGDKGLGSEIGTTQARSRGFKPEANAKKVPVRINMATALFINRTDLVKNSIIDGNVDTDKFIQFIKVAQQIDIQNLLGTELYKKIGADITSGAGGGTGLSGNYLTLVTEFIQPTLIWFAQMNYIPFAAYQIKNGGVFKHSSETAQNVDKNEVDYLVSKAREYANYYSTRLVDYLLFNDNLFPEYNNNSNEDISPDTDTTFNGWVL